MKSRVKVAIFLFIARNRHAFNDEAILNAFNDSMIRNNQLQLIVLGNNSDEIREQFPERLRERITIARLEIKATGDMGNL